MCVFCVRIRLLRPFVYVFCARCAAFAYVYRFLCALSGFCVRIRLIFLRALSGFWFVESLDDPIFRVLWFAESPDNPILRVLWFFESPDDPILRVLWFAESPCERSWWLDRMEDPIFRVLSSCLSENLHAIDCPNLPCFFLVDLDIGIYLSRWSNITVHYADLW